jgi:hypothetical protein
VYVLGQLLGQAKVWASSPQIPEGPVTGSQDLATDRPKSATKETVLVEVSVTRDYVLFCGGSLPRFTSPESGGFTWLVDSEPFSY